MPVYPDRCSVCEAPMQAPGPRRWTGERTSAPLRVCKLCRADGWEVNKWSETVQHRCLPGRPDRVRRGRESKWFAMEMERARG